MVKHIVMWKMKDTSNSDKIKNMELMKEKLEALKDLTSELLEAEVGFNISESERAFDIVLYSEFESVETLDRYRVHPEHKKVVEFINLVTKEVRAVDYQL